VQVVDDAKVDEAKVRSLDGRGIARPAPNVLHFLVGSAAPQLEAIQRTNSAETRGCGAGTSGAATEKVSFEVLNGRARWAGRHPTNYSKTQCIRFRR
jgi:hypothetical protein